MADPLVFKDDEPLTGERLTLAFRSLDLRQRAAEGVVIDWQAAVEELRSFGLLRLNSAIEPVYERLTAIAQLGVVFTASSATAAVLGTGIRTFQLSAADRDRFAAAAYLAARQVGDPDTALSGALQSYDRTTGTLVIAVDQFSGTLGEEAGPWTISPAASADLGGYTKGEVDDLVEQRQPLSPNLTALATGVQSAFGRNLLGILDEDQLVLLLGLTRFDVGLGNVSNTADADKPVSTAVATALAGKAPRLAVPAIRSANAAGTIADDGAIVRLTGSPTYTLPSAADLGAGGHLVVRNDGSAVVTILPAGTDVIDGVAGARKLLPRQVAMLFRSGAGAFSWLWLDRCPVLSDVEALAGVAWLAPSIPAGWKRVALDMQLTVGTLAAQPRLQVSQDNDATVYLGDYFGLGLAGVAPSNVGALSYASPFLAIGGATAAARGSCTVHGELDCDPAGLIKLAVNGVQNGSSQEEARLEGGYTGIIGAITNLRVFASAGTIAGRIAVRGIF